MGVVPDTSTFDDFDNLRTYEVFSQLLYNNVKVLYLNNETKYYC